MTAARLSSCCTTQLSTTDCHPLANATAFIRLGWDSFYPPGWLEGRKAQLSSPVIMAGELCDSVLSGVLTDALQRLSPLTSLDLKVSLPLLQLLCKSEVERNLAPAEELLEKYKSSKAPGDPWPLLVIDQANVMQERWPWTASDEPSLRDKQAIMAFLVQARHGGGKDLALSSLHPCSRMRCLKLPVSCMSACYREKPCTAALTWLPLRVSTTARRVQSNHGCST